MRVCFLTSSFPRYEGDHVGIVIFEEARRLVRAGLSVSVIAPHDIGAKHHEIVEGISIHRFQYMYPARLQGLTYRNGIVGNLRRKKWTALLLPLFTVSFILKTLAVARQADIIHAHWASTGFIGAITKLFLGLPMVVTLHGSDIALLPNRGMLRRLTRVILNRADAVIGVSHALIQEITALGITTPRILRIPNGVPHLENLLAVVEKKVGSGVVLFIGRLSEEKNVSVLLRAFSQVHDEFAQARLLVVGDGPLRHTLEHEAQQLGISACTDFYGFRPPEKLSSIFARADLLVLPSRREGFGVVLIEAMASGRPVIGTRVGGIIDVIDDHRNGLLVPPDEVQPLAEAMSAVLRNNQLRLQYGRTARDKITQQFSWQKITSQLISVYQQVLENYHSK